MTTAVTNVNKTVCLTSIKELLAIQTANESPLLDMSKTCSWMLTHQHLRVSVLIVRRRYFCWLSHTCLYAVHLGEGNLWSVNLHAESVTGQGAIFKKGS